MKNSGDTSWDRTSDLPICSTALYTTVLPRSPIINSSNLIYFLTAIGLSPVGIITARIYTRTIHRTTQITTKQHKIGRVRAMPRLYEFYSGICLTIEELQSVRGHSAIVCDGHS